MVLKTSEGSGFTYDGELAGNILLEESDVSEGLGAGLRQPYIPDGRQFDVPSFSVTNFTLTDPSAPRDFWQDRPRESPAPTPPGARTRSAQDRLAAPGAGFSARTPSPVYQWNKPKKINLGREEFQETSSGASSPKGASEHQAGSLLQSQMAFPPFYPLFGLQGALNPQAYYAGMMMNPLLGQAAAAVAAQAAGSEGAPATGVDGLSQPGVPTMDPHLLQMMIAMQDHAAPPSPAGTGSGNAHGGSAACSSAADERPQSGRVDNSRFGAGSPVEGRRKARGGKDTVAKQTAKEEAAATPAREKVKTERRKRGGGGGGGGAAPSGGSGGVHSTAGHVAGGSGAAEEDRGAGKSREPRSHASSPIIEQLKQRDRNVELSELTWHIGEIAQDQYGSRLIQQKLEVANDEEKQLAFKAVLQQMPQLTTDVFGNYVIQKFFEYGSTEQRRVLAEQLVGQVLKLSLQMYGCRVVQKALDSVPIEQQVLLVGELKGHIIQCIEDQHGNHVVQKCIERLPTDKINFIVEAFNGEVGRMAKHCYGCRVLQRLIEYCSSVQISALLDEVLRSCLDLANDQYGNYVVQHTLEHSTRGCDRQLVLQFVCKNILSLSCHKYASNVVERALLCGTLEERASVIGAILGDQVDAHPPLVTMMRDRFGNYIVQRMINLAQGPQRGMLFWRLETQMPLLRKSSTYGKHIIAALQQAQSTDRKSVV